MSELEKLTRRAELFEVRVEITELCSAYAQALRGPIRVTLGGRKFPGDMPKSSPGWAGRRLSASTDLIPARRYSSEGGRVTVLGIDAGLHDRDDAGTRRR